MIIRLFMNDYIDIYVKEDGKVYINDEILEEEYIDSDVTTIRSGEFYDLTVPEEYVFVMGDNRSNSKDSREIGLVRYDDLAGIVKYRIENNFILNWGELE